MILNLESKLTKYTLSTDSETFVVCGSGIDFMYNKYIGVFLYTKLHEITHHFSNKDFESRAFSPPERVSLR